MHNSDRNAMVPRNAAATGRWRRDRLETRVPVRLRLGCLLIHSVTPEGHYVRNRDWDRYADPRDLDFFRVFDAL
jgi:hypothetical protein